MSDPYSDANNPKGEEAARESNPSSVISDEDRREIREHSSGSAKVVHEIVRLRGDAELNRPVRSLLFSGFAAGLGVSMSLIGEATLHARLPEAHWAELITPLGYTLGFILVILGSLQLFTESTVTAVLPLATHPTLRNVGRLLRLWTVVFLANMAGTFFISAMIAFGNVLAPGDLVAALEVSRSILSHGPLATLLLAMPAGFLIASLVWLLPNTRGGEFWAILFVTYFVALGGFSHVVVGSTEAWLLMLNNEITIADAVAAFILPALVGNILGGAGLFALVAHGQVHDEIEPNP